MGVPSQTGADMSSLEPGDLLIAPPSIPDSRFRESVIMITHQQNMTLGFCINRPMGIDLSMVLKDSGYTTDYEAEVFWGGPVNTNTVWVLHDHHWQTPWSLGIDDHWQMISHQQMFDLWPKEDLDFDHRVIMGCSSWAPGQLDCELRGEAPWQRDHSWLYLRRPPRSLITACPPGEMWRKATELSVKQTVASVMA